MNKHEVKIRIVVGAVLLVVLGIAAVLSYWLANRADRCYKSQDEYNAQARQVRTEAMHKFAQYALILPADRISNLLLYLQGQYHDARIDVIKQQLIPEADRAAIAEYDTQDTLAKKFEADGEAYVFCGRVLVVCSLAMLGFAAIVFVLTALFFWDCEQRRLMMQRPQPG